MAPALSIKATSMSGALGHCSSERAAALAKLETQQTAGFHPCERLQQEAKRSGIAREP